MNSNDRDNLREIEIQRRILIIVLVVAAPVFFGLLAWAGLLGP